MGKYVNRNRTFRVLQSDAVPIGQKRSCAPALLFPIVEWAVGDLDTLLLIALVERVDQLAHLRGVPYERTLHLGDGDVARGYEAQYLLDGLLRDRITVLHTLDLLFR